MKRARQNTLKNIFNSSKLDATVHKRFNNHIVMKKCRNIIIVAFWSALIISCVTSYDPNITKYESVFVVDGELNNLPGPYTVTLSRSYDFNKSSGNFVSGAQVKIFDNTGLEVVLQETGEGVYSTTDSTFRGVIGNSYKLQIMVDGEVYESDFETLKNPVPIDRVYWEYNSENKSVQLFVDTHDSTNSTHYYSWQYEETWRFQVPIDVTGKSEWKECYWYNNSNNFNIGTSTHRKGDIIDRQPIQFIDENTNRLFMRYSMLVKQLALSEQAYKFFSDLNTLNQNQGTLFDPIPYSLTGNMKNITNKDVPVLGYFLVAGASEKRIFIDRKELPKDFYPTDGFDYCLTELVFIDKDLTNYRQDLIADSLMNKGYVVYDNYLITLSLGDTVRELYMAKPPCFNCTLNGKSEVPDFWVERDSN